MSVFYFAHNGVEHATTAEAAEHQVSNHGPAILLITVLVIALAFIGLKLLAKESSDKEQQK